EFNHIALRRSHVTWRHYCDKREAQRQPDAKNDRVNDPKTKVREIYVNRLVGRRSSIGIDMAKQAIGYPNEGLVFPGIAARGTLPTGDFAVFQHPSAPLPEIAPRAFKSSKRRRKNKK